MIAGGGLGSREVLSNFYEVFCELRRLKKNSRKRADPRWRAGPFWGEEGGMGREAGYMHKCGGREDRREGGGLLMELKGGVRRRLRAGLKTAGSLKVGSPQPSVHRPPAIPGPAASVLLISSRLPQDPPMTLPPPLFINGCCVLSSAPPPPRVHCHKDLTAQGQSWPSASGHRGDGLHL